MSTGSWVVIEHMLKGGAGLFAVVAALLAALDQIKMEEHGAMRRWCGRMWEAIECSAWLRMPRRVIGAALWVRDELLQSVADRWSRSIWPEALVRLGMPAVVFSGTFLKWGIWVALPVVAAFLVGMRLAESLEPWSRSFTRCPRWVLHAASWSVLVTFIVACVLWLHEALSTSVGYAAMAMTAFAPFLFLATGILLSSGYLICHPKPPWRPGTVMRALAALALGASVGFPITLAAMFIGHVAEPRAWVPQTLQMLLCNVACDGLTLVVTFRLLEWVMPRSGWWRIPFVVMVDALASAGLACLSLLLGLAFTPNAVAPAHVLRILLGRAADGSSWELGPFFWTMHTTFIPTGVYLAAVALAWLGKTILEIAKHYLRLSSAHPNPVKLTYTLSASTAAVLAILGQLVRWLSRTS